MTVEVDGQGERMCRIRGRLVIPTILGVIAIAGPSQATPALSSYHSFARSVAAGQLAISLNGTSIGGGLGVVTAEAFSPPNPSLPASGLAIAQAGLIDPDAGLTAEAPEARACVGEIQNTSGPGFEAGPAVGSTEKLGAGIIPYPEYPRALLGAANVQTAELNVDLRRTGVDMEGLLGPLIDAFEEGGQNSPASLLNSNLHLIELMVEEQTGMRPDLELPSLRYAVLNSPLMTLRGIRSWTYLERLAASRAEFDVDSIALLGGWLRIDGISTWAKAFVDGREASAHFGTTAGQTIGSVVLGSGSAVFGSSFYGTSDFHIFGRTFPGLPQVFIDEVIESIGLKISVGTTKVVPSAYASRAEAPSIKIELAPPGPDGQPLFSLAVEIPSVAAEVVGNVPDGPPLC